MRLLLSATVLMLGVAAGLPAALDRDGKVRHDRAEVQAEGRWIYNDLAKGFAEAKLTGKPLLVVLRCIP